MKSSAVISWIKEEISQKVCYVLTTRGTSDSFVTTINVPITDFPLQMLIDLLSCSLSYGVQLSVVPHGLFPPGN